MDKYAQWLHASLRQVQSAMPRLIHKGEHGAHMAYLGLVAIESHGYYGKAALVMLVLLVVSHFTGDAE